MATSPANQSSRPVALITGASGGIGRACALALAGAPEPFDLALQFRNHSAEAEKLSAEIEATGRAKAKIFQADLSAADACTKLVEDVAAQLGPPAALIHAAGHIVEKPLGFTSAADFSALLEVHAAAAALLCKALTRYIRKSDRGRIVLIGSLAGEVGLGNAAAYAAAKGALGGLCRCFALEGARWKTTVNVIAPGYVETEMTQAHDADRRAANAASIPLGRYATAEEIGALAAFLCSRQASYITGQSIVVDGGMSLG